MIRILLFALAALLTVPLVAQDMPLSQVLIPGEEWQLVGEGYEFTEGPSAAPDGTVYFTDIRASKIYHVAGDGPPTVFVENSAKTNGLFFGPDGKLYGCRADDKQIVAYNTADGSHEVIAEGIDSNDLVVDAKGGVYATDPPGNRVWFIALDRSKRVVAEGFTPNGVILTPDSGTLVVTDRENPWLWAFRVHADGSLDGQESYYRPLVLPYGEERPRSDGMTVDADGRLYVATAVGIQVFDPTGRPCGVILKPDESRTMGGSNVTFGGPDRDWLYYTVTDRVYRRKTQVKGVTAKAP